jgi:hypothetical protein
VAGRLCDGNLAATASPDGVHSATNPREERAVGPSFTHLKHTSRVVVAVAMAVFAFAVLASTASARAVDAAGLPRPNLASSAHSAPAPASSDGTDAATIAAMFAGGVVFVVGGVLVFDAISGHAVRLHR